MNYTYMTLIFFRDEQEVRRQEYNTLIERVFRSEDKTRQDTSVNRIDLDAIEKEISIDIAELRRDLRALRRDLLAKIGKAFLEDGFIMIFGVCQH